jgi:hypothetical protein
MGGSGNARKLFGGGSEGGRGMLGSCLGVGTRGVGACSEVDRGRFEPGGRTRARRRRRSGTGSKNSARSVAGVFGPDVAGRGFGGLAFGLKQRRTTATPSCSPSPSWWNIEPTGALRIDICRGDASHLSSNSPKPPTLLPLVRPSFDVQGPSPPRSSEPHHSGAGDAQLVDARGSRERRTLARSRAITSSKSTRVSSPRARASRRRSSSALQDARTSSGEDLSPTLSVKIAAISARSPSDSCSAASRMRLASAVIVVSVGRARDPSH